MQELIDASASQIQDMFSQIAPRYDLLNRLMTLGFDKKWRKKMVGILPQTSSNKKYLDLATGTGDVPMMILKPKEHPRANIDAVDFSLPMIQLAKEKVKKKGLEKQIHFHCCDVEELPFSNNTYDGATIAFGIRNVIDRAKALKEIQRVLKPNAPLVILEALPPKNKWQRKIQNFHLTFTVRLLGNILSQGKAYRYFGNSVGEFPSAKDFLHILEENGFHHCQTKPLTLGAVSLLWGYK